MNNADLVAVLKTVPETTLEILVMAQEATLPDGSVDFEGIMVQEGRLILAEAEARIQAHRATRIGKEVKSKMRG